MNAKKVIATVALFAAAGAAMADQTYPWVEQDIVSTKTRAQVQAELKQAHAEGQFAYTWNFDASQTTHVTSAKTDAPVEAKQASANGAASAKSRDEVRAELEQAYKQGDYAYTHNHDVPEATTVASVKVRDDAIRSAQGKQAKGTSFGG